MGGGCGEFPGYYGQIEGFGSRFKRDIKRYYPTSVGALIQAPTLPQSHQLRRHRPREKKTYSVSPAPVSFSVGIERVDDVGTLKASDD